MTSALHEIARLKQRLAALEPEAVTKARTVAVERLEGLQVAGDPEVQHEVADQALCQFLRAIGHGQVADEFEAVERWYG
jgi:hypothetical protein